LTKTESGTPSPVNANLARDDVPASRPITDTDVTWRRIIRDSDSASRSEIVRGSDRIRPMTASVATRCIPRPRCAANPRAGTARRDVWATDASLQQVDDL